MPKTKLENLINPEVMADMISAKLDKGIKFSPLAEIDTTLEGQPGDTITIPAYKYVGDAEDLTEGVAMDTVLLEATAKSATIKEAGKSIEITDKSVNSGYGNPIDEANEQILMSLNAKIDNDCVIALTSGTLEHDVSQTSQISYDAVAGALDKFEDEDDEVKILFIHSLQKSTLRKDEEFIPKNKLTDAPLIKGVIGEIAGCQVVVSNKVPYNSTDGTYKNIIAKKGALSIFLKKRAKVESDRDIRARTTVIAASEYYVAELVNDSKVVKLITSATKIETPAQS